MSVGATFTVDLKAPLDAFTLECAFTSHERILGLFGPSGCGKTTILESIAGLRHDVEGLIRCGDAVWLDSQNGIRLPPQERRIGYVPQDLLLFPHLTVAAHLEVGLRRMREAGAEGSAQALRNDVIVALELKPLLARRPSELSGGERQRVALGRALCSGPQLILLDEPMAALDYGLRQKILPFLRRVCTQFEIPVLIVSHQPWELQALCSEIVALHAGKILAQGTPLEVFSDPVVYPGANEAGFENVLPAVVTHRSEHAVILTVGHAPTGPTLTITPPAPPENSVVHIALPARDLILATEPSKGLSARNCLAARIVAQKALEGRILLTVELIGPERWSLLVEVTQDAVTALDLAPERAVWVIFKSSAVRLCG